MVISARLWAWLVQPRRGVCYVAYASRSDRLTLLLSGLIPRTDQTAFSARYQKPPVRLKPRCHNNQLSRFAYLALAALACSTGHAQPATPVILISVDTLRADHLSCYQAGRQ